MFLIVKRAERRDKVSEDQGKELGQSNFHAITPGLLPFLIFGREGKAVVGSEEGSVVENAEFITGLARIVR